MNMLRNEFPFELTAKQEQAALGLFQFLYGSDGRSIHLLRGYAGTGKTLLVSALVRTLHRLKIPAILLAPTGRAAKVFSIHAGTAAYTIHKQIYRQRSLTSENSLFDLDRNTHKDTLFIVDESSMISAPEDFRSIFGSGNLLEDLLRYVYSGANCRLLFVGDNAQLPPVGDDVSPALSASALRNLDFAVSGFQLTEVMRQEQDSGILYNATRLRQSIRLATDGEPRITLGRFKDLRRLCGDEIIETLQRSYDTVGQDGTIVLTRSNKQANMYNQGIRSTFFGREDMLQRGDIIMVVRNNYYWAELEAQKRKNEGNSEMPPMDFIANGDIAEVLSVQDEMEFYGLHFADVQIRFPDYNGFEMQVRVLLDAMQSEGPSLTPEQDRQLFQGVSEDYADERNKKERMKKVRMDPNYNALQIKYAYAVTCHKAQGGQWRHVFLDQGWMPPDGYDVQYYRWLYTAFTRATEKLYLINWPESQIEDYE